MTRLRTWWDGLQPRERVMVGVAAACVACFVAWYGVWRPLRDARDEGETRLLQARASLARAQADAVLVATAGRRPLPGEAAAALASSARAAGLAVQRQQPGATPGELLVSVDADSTAAVLAWLAELRRVHGVAPADVRLSRAEGRLRADVLVVAGR